MMKKILSLAIIAAAALGISASAQQNKMYQPQQFTDFAFEGILLDMDQQDKINNINNAFHLNGQPAVAVEKAKADTAKVDRKQRTRQRMEQPSPANDPNIRREYAKQVKQVLTPEQYTVFLENIAFMPQGPQKHVGSPRSKNYKDAKVKDGKDLKHNDNVKGSDRRIKPAKKDK